MPCCVMQQGIFTLYYGQEEMKMQGGGKPEDSNSLRLSQGQILFLEGDAANDMFYVLEGEVEIFKTMEGRRIVITTLGKGEVFGEMGLLTEGSKRTASAQATKDSTILALTKEEFLKRITLTPTFCLTILKSLAERLEKATSELILLKYVISGE